jgi:hypothetical protein
VTLEPYGLRIGGDLSAAADGSAFGSYDPSTGRPWQEDSPDWLAR